MTLTQEQPTTNVWGDMPHNIPGRHRYSLVRAVKRMADHQGRVPDGLEGEVHHEIARRTGKTPKGLLIPLDMPLPGPIEQRALTTVTGAGAMQTTRPAVLIDVLRAKLCMAALGAQIRDITDGLRSGSVFLPVKSSAAAVSWVGEVPTPTETNLVSAGTLMTPRTVMAYTDVSRRLLTEATKDFENLIIEDLAGSIAIALDAAAINGPGTPNNPLGIFQYGSAIPYVMPSGDTTGNGAAPTLADICAMEYKIGITNGDAPADSRIGMLTSPAGRNALRQLDLGTASGRKAWQAHPMVIDGRVQTVETVMGYRAMATTNVPANLVKGSGTNLTAGCLGNWNDLLINLFTGVDIIVNPFLQSINTIVRITALQDVDVAIRHPGSFCLIAGWVAPTVA